MKELKLKRIAEDQEFGIVFCTGHVSQIRESDGTLVPYFDTYNTWFDDRALMEGALTYADHNVQVDERNSIRSPLYNQHSNMIIGNTPFIMPIGANLIEAIRNMDRTQTLYGIRPNPANREAVMRSMRENPNQRLSVGGQITRSKKDA